MKICTGKGYDQRCYRLRGEDMRAKLVGPALLRLRGENMRAKVVGPALL